MHAPVKPDLTTRTRDLRIDLVRGIANLSIFVDHIPHNAVNLLTLRNFGFSGATDLFVFVGGYAAALLYGQMARGARLPRHRDADPEAGLATLRGLYRAVRDLYRRHRPGRRTIRGARHHRRVQRHGHRRSSGAGAGARAAAAGQAAQPRYAAARLSASGGVSPDPRRHAALAEADARRIGCALYRRAPVRSLSRLVSGRPLVFQSVLLAAAVRARRLVRARRRPPCARVAGSCAAAMAGAGLACVRAADHDGGQGSAIRKPHSGCPAQPVHAERQAKPRALSRAAFAGAGVPLHVVCAARLARPSRESAAARHQMRRRMARLLLCRRVPCPCRAHGADHEHPIRLPCRCWSASPARRR